MVNKTAMSGILFSHKEENLAICSNMDGPRDYHAKWSQTEKEYHIIAHLYVESEKMIQMNLFTKQK